MTGGSADSAEQTAICFALDNTLLTYDRPYADIVRDGLAEHVDSPTESMVEDVVVTLRDSLGGIVDDPYRTATAAAFEGEEPPVAFENLLESLRRAELEGTSVSDVARSSLETLVADDDTVVCLLTDGHHDWQRRKLVHHDVDQHFEHVVTSYDAGGPKESAAPYEFLRELVAADEYVMIGDDYAADVEAARAAGFVPIHYEQTDGPDFFATLQAML